MKKSIKMLLMVFAVAFGALLVSGTASKAASAAAQNWNAGLTQVDADTQNVALQWQASFADNAGHYRIFVGTSQNQMTEKDYTSSTNAIIRNLTPNSVYYVQVQVWSEYHFSDDSVLVAASEVIPVCTLPEVGSVTGLQQTNATTSSITMSWTAVRGATSYDVYRYNGWKDYTKVASDVKGTACTVSRLSASTAVKYFVIAKQAAPLYGLVGVSSQFTEVEMKTVPGKVALIAMSSYYDSLGEAGFKWSTVNNVTGYQFELRDYKNKLLFSKDTGSYYGYSVNVSPFKKGVFTKARARAYILVGNKKLYGAWSGYTYNASNKKITVRRTRNGKKITVKWKKISGASGYKVSISTKDGSGYKKVKTLSKKKSSITITKCGKKKLKKNKRYYIRVQYLTKAGKKTITSNIVGSGSI